MARRAGILGAAILCCAAGGAAEPDGPVQINIAVNAGGRATLRFVPPRDAVVNRVVQALRAGGCADPRLFRAGLRARCAAERISGLQYRLRFDPRPLAAALRDSGVQSLRFVVYGPRALRSEAIIFPPGWERLDAAIGPGASTVVSSDGGEPFEVVYGFGLGELVRRNWPAAVLLAACLGAAWRASRTASWYGYLRAVNAFTLFAWVSWVAMAASRPLDLLAMLEAPAWAIVAGVLGYLAAVPVAAECLFLALTRGAVKRLRGIERPRRRIVEECFWRNAVWIGPLMTVGVAAFSGDGDLRIDRVAAGLALALPVMSISSRMAVRARRQEMRPLETGALRDRAFELAEKAGVKLRGVFLLAGGDASLGNAYASAGNTILLDERLVLNLDRREMDGVLAHEIGHLKGRHPLLMLGAVFAPVLILSAALGASDNELVARSSGLLAIAPALGITSTLLRGLERRADRRAASLAGDPEAVIAGLSRVAELNLLPVRWSQRDAKLFAYPSFEDRTAEIAKRFDVPAGRVAELMSPERERGEPYEIPAEAAPRVFSAGYRQTLAFRNSWLYVAALVLPPAAAAWAAGRRPDLAAVLYVAGLVGAVAACDLVSAATSRLDGRRLARGVARALGCGEEDIAGLSPGASYRLYDGFYDHDMGCVTTTGACLEYRGESARFTIAAQKISDVRIVPGPPKWRSTSAIAVDWTAARGNESFLLLWTGGEAVVRERFAALRKWWEERQASDAACEERAPDFSGVEGASPKEVVRPGAVLKSQLFVAVYSVSVALLTGFPGGPYIPTVAAAGLMWQYVPAFFYRESE